MHAKRRFVGSSTWVAAVLLGLSAPLASAASVHGEAAVGVTGSSETSDETEPAFVGDTISVNNGTSAASAWYAASLASATLSSYAAASAEPATAYGAGAHAEVGSLSFADTLSFHIPAGTYASGLSVRFEGFTLGSLLALGCRPSPVPACSNGYHVVDFYVGSPYGSDTYHARGDVDAGSTPAGGMNALFLLDLDILDGRTLAAPLDVAVSVTGSLSTKGAALNTYGYSGDDSTMFAGDLFAGFTGIDTPANVTWSSESGLFLLQPVPEPASLSLMLAGAAAIALVLARRRLKPN